MNESYASAGLVRQIDRAADDIDYYMQELTGRKIAYEDGNEILDALFFSKITIEQAMNRIEHVLTPKAVCRG